MLGTAFDFLCHRTTGAVYGPASYLHTGGKTGSLSEHDWVLFDRGLTYIRDVSYCTSEKLDFSPISTTSEAGQRYIL